MALHDLTEPLTAAGSLTASSRREPWPLLPTGGPAVGVGDGPATGVSAGVAAGALASAASAVGAADDDPLDTPLRLPDPPSPPRRGALPLVASAVPVIGALVLWAVTGTVMMLWFAALGPAIAAASLVDGARAARSARRRNTHEAAGARRRVAAVVQARHERERRHAWARHPDVLALTGADARPGGVWRAGRGDTLVVGRGAARSAVRVDGGGEDPDARELARSAAMLDNAPVIVAADAGIAVCGPEPLARAVVRALALQACLTMPPDVLRLAPGSAGYSEDWAAALPHARSGASTRRLALWEQGMPVSGGDVVIARVDAGRLPPPGCAVVITLVGPDRARLDHDGLSREIGVEGIGLDQARGLAAALVRRADAAYGSDGDDHAVELSDLLGDPAPPDARDLRAPIGVELGAGFAVDLVEDGPHALVAGMTGAGKSELLTTLITALCARFTTEQVTFLLADFKGGTAFDRLQDLPHVTGVITDLDAGGARRALQSLRAELRRREAELVRAGARDITGTRLPRLVIVVDEYAALTWAHPELDAVFTDIAARGRALGMHLVLGTQRASGTFRDGLLANCPLRISLRVSDPADSRALIGTDAAAALPGDAGRRGTALVRRAADDAPHTVRVALTSPQLVAATTAGARGPVPRRTWLPPLPERLTLAEASRDVPGADRTVLGIADAPEHQRRVPVVLAVDERGLCAIGAAGSGRTGLLETIAAQAAAAIWIPRDPEQAWDLIGRLVAQPAGGEAIVLADDLDALLTRFPPDYAQVVGERLERLVHAAGAGGPRVVISAQRMTGAVGRLAELLPRRVVLRCASRAEAVAAGGAVADLDDRIPPGRAVVDGRLVQVALPPAPRPAESTAVPAWRPSAALTGVVTRGGSVRTAVEAIAAAAGARLVAPDEAASLGAGGIVGVSPIVVVGDGEQWQRAWQALQAVRAGNDLLVDAACPADYRLLTGDRALPPYAEPGRGRAWLIRAGGEPERVQIVPDPA